VKKLESDLQESREALKLATKRASEEETKLSSANSMIVRLETLARKFVYGCGDFTVGRLGQGGA